jgi:hypothetical protein
VSKEEKGSEKNEEDEGIVRLGGWGGLVGGR